MKLPEYMAKALFDKFGIPTMRGCLINSADNIAEQIEAAGLAYPVVIKAQVQIGGRGKAGGIQFAQNADEAMAHCTRLLGSELLGYRVDQLLVVEKAEHGREWYLSILLDRLSKQPMVIFSEMGGMEIEQTAKTDPGRIKKLLIDPMIGVQEYQARYLLSASGLPMEYAGQLDALLRNLYRAFMEKDALLVEINPLAVDQGNKLVALDGKVDIDDSALYRQPDILAYRDGMREEDFVKEARSFNFLYIPVEKGGTIAVVSNGSGMLMSCIDMIARDSMTVGAALDLGGGATADRICEAMRIMFATPYIKAVLINIFGGITRCDEVAGGVKMAFEKYDLGDKLVVIRMEGTNKEQGLQIIQSLSGNVIPVAGMRESMAALVERRGRL